MKSFRRLLFWCHLITGVAVGVIVLLLATTGVLLTYQRQITAWADTRGLISAPPTAQSLPLAVDTLLDRAPRRDSVAPSSVIWSSRRDAPVAITFGRDRTLFLNAYTGVPLSEGSPAVRRFFRAIVDWHRYIGRSGDRRPLGKAATGAANLGFLLLVLSGFYLWFPRNWKRAAVANVTLFRSGLTGKARDFNWHNAAGAWSLIPLFLIVISGVVISYPWATALVFRLVGESPPSATPARPAPAPVRAGVVAPGAMTTGAPTSDAGRDTTTRALAERSTALEPFVALARQKMPGWKALTLQLPPEDAKINAVVFVIDRGSGGQPQARAQLTFDRATGAELRWEPFSAGTLGRRLRSVLRFTHTGEVLGIVGQTIAGLASLGAMLLVCTGLSLAWRRFRNWRSATRAA